MVNATGIILHTNLGRAPLNEETAQVMKSLSQGYSNLEYDLDRGKRGHRDRHLEEQFRRLLPCEAATAVNNNAAALFLVLSTLARGRKVLVSRGELVEIGGSFRVPSILEQSGASLKEVGTTNRTRIEDYRDALDGDTALILRVHPSNFRVVGFSRRPALSELAALSREAGIPLLKDAGSGYLFRTSHPSLRSEPTVEEILKAGVDLVCFSGDKLLGGPQAGIVLGKRSLMEAVRKNPLARVCRLDKATFAGLEQTLSIYEQGVYLERLPVYRMLGTSSASLEGRARQIRRVWTRERTGAGSWTVSPWLAADRPLRKPFPPSCWRSAPRPFPATSWPDASAVGPDPWWPESRTIGSSWICGRCCPRKTRFWSNPCPRRRRKTDMAENPLAPPRDRQLLEFFCRQYGLRPGEDRLHTLGTLARSFSQLPYENLTKIIRSSRNGKGPAARRLPTQVLTDHRELGTGGTCFSLTATLLHLVRSLGFRAQPILADRHYGSDTHSALLVWIRGRPHLLDPGYLVVEPIPLEESREVEVKTPFNRLLLSPESPERMRLYTRQQGGRSHRLTFKTSPADPGQFLKAWTNPFPGK